MLEIATRNIKLKVIHLQSVFLTNLIHHGWHKTLYLQY